MTASNVQTSYSATRTAGIAGQVVHQDYVESAANSASTGPVAGQLCILSTADGLCRPLATGDTPVDDDNAIIASGIASAATKQLVTGASLNGVTGTAVMWPPRNATVTLGSSADWNYTGPLVIRGLDAFGMPTSEAFSIPDAGAVVLTGSVIFSKITEVEIPGGQGGTGGTFLVGTGVKIGPCDRKVRGFALYQGTRESGAYAQYEDVPLMRRGILWVTAEGTVVKGDPVYVRFVVTGNEVYGGLSNAPDSTDCALLRGAKWASSRTGAGIAQLEVYL